MKRLVGLRFLRRHRRDWTPSRKQRRDASRFCPVLLDDLPASGHPDACPAGHPDACIRACIRTPSFRRPSSRILFFKRRDVSAQGCLSADDSGSEPVKGCVSDGTRIGEALLRRVDR